MCDGGDETKYWICGSTCGVIAVIALVLLGASIHKLEDYEIGLNYNPNSVAINKDKLYEGGTYITGPGHRFIKFSKNLKTIYMGSSESEEADIVYKALDSRTKDALEVEVECSF